MKVFICKYHVFLIVFLTFNFNLIAQSTNVVEDSLFLNYKFSGEIKVTATKLNKELKYVSIPIEITNARDFFINNGVTISDVIKNKAGISLIRDGIWATDISIRGLNKNNIVALVDGNRIETSNDLSAGLSLIEVDNIKSVEVVKGSVSSLYGSGAVGGIINILTDNDNYFDKFILKSELVSSYMNVNNNFSTSLNFKAGNENWFSNFSTTLRNAGNTKTPNGVLQNSQFRNYNFSFSGGLKFNNNEFKISAHNYTAKDVGIPGGNILFPANAEVKYLTAERKMFSVEHNIKNISSYLLNLKTKIFYQEINRDVENIPNQITTVPIASTNNFRRTSVLKITPTGNHETTGFSLQSNWLLLNNYFVIAGFELWERKLKTYRERELLIETLSDNQNLINSTNKLIAEKPIPDAHFQSIGLYINNEYELIKNKFNLTIGGRVDKINVKNNVVYNPLFEINDNVKNDNPSNKKLIWNENNVSNISWSSNISIKYNLTDKTDLIFSTARSFRSPSLEERFQYIDLGNLIRIGNPNLEPENGYFFDLGMRIFDNNIMFSGNIFINYLNNLVSEAPGIYENRNALIKINIGNARLYGFDFTLNYIFNKIFFMNSTFAYVKGTDTKNNVPLPQIPAFNGRINLGIKVTNEVEMNFIASFTGNQNDVSPNEISTSGYTVYDINFNTFPFSFYQSVIQLTCGVENITDKSYRNHLSTNRGLITSEPGRNFYIKIKLSL